MNHENDNNNHTHDLDHSYGQEPILNTTTHTRHDNDGVEYNDKNNLSQSIAPISSSTGPKFPGDPDYIINSSSNPTTGNARKTQLSNRAFLAPTIISRNQAINRVDLIASAERIYARYLLPGSEKEIYLPSNLRINTFPVSSSSLPHPNDLQQQRALASIPDMFHTQKE